MQTLKTRKKRSGKTTTPEAPAKSPDHLWNLIHRRRFDEGDYATPHDDVISSSFDGSVAVKTCGDVKTHSDGQEGVLANTSDDTEKFAVHEPLDDPVVPIREM
ncbi:hypothetical protein PISMIDRAFT_18953 [Pisolithus microcarpus 441]|uniref:Uncharacterized protein n=1 Tax=Pisolithus microcarpus 441 TaxID=765257 RepID=A0A0C9YW72_9AGAM|nr:hypothetical protein PISMIDRAFT_18953 [Pisolithus microcarpus 441]